MIDSDDFIDPEPGAPSLSARGRRSQRSVQRVAHALQLCFLLGYAWEYYQEHCDVLHLKEEARTHTWCHEVEVSLFMRLLNVWSGLANEQARQCVDWHRAQSLMSWPNPFVAQLRVARMHGREPGPRHQPHPILSILLHSTHHDDLRSSSVRCAAVPRRACNALSAHALLLNSMGKRREEYQNVCESSGSATASCGLHEGGRCAPHQWSALSTRTR